MNRLLDARNRAERIFQADQVKKESTFEEFALCRLSKLVVDALDCVIEQKPFESQHLSESQTGIIMNIDIALSSNKIQNPAFIEFAYSLIVLFKEMEGTSIVGQNSRPKIESSIDDQMEEKSEEIIYKQDMSVKEETIDEFEDVCQLNESVIPNTVEKGKDDSAKFPLKQNQETLPTRPVNTQKSQGSINTQRLIYGSGAVSSNVHRIDVEHSSKQYYRHPRRLCVVCKKKEHLERMHKFTAVDRKRQAWIDGVRATPEGRRKLAYTVFKLNNPYLCASHFPPSCFITLGSSVVLRGGAVPQYVDPAERPVVAPTTEPLPPPPTVNRIVAPAHPITAINKNFRVPVIRQWAVIPDQQKGTCEHCNEIHRFVDLDIHTALLHSEIWLKDAYKCPVRECDYRSMIQQKRLDHAHVAHSCSSSFEFYKIPLDVSCPYCNRIVTSIGDYTTHMACHRSMMISQAPIHICNSCGFKAARIYQMIQHWTLNPLKCEPGLHFDYQLAAIMKRQNVLQPSNGIVGKKRRVD